MTSKQIDQDMRQLEWYHQMRVPGQRWIILRMDGRGFSKLTENFDHPFDTHFQNAMESTLLDLMVEFNALYGYSQSDEISILLPRNFELFNRSVEKLVSLSASITAASFNRHLQLHKNIRTVSATFDSRICVTDADDDVVDYFVWRLQDAKRNALTSALYWQLRADDHSARAAHKLLFGKGSEEQRNMLLADFDSLPEGIAMSKHPVLVTGWNPIRESPEQAVRTKILLERIPQSYEEYRNMLRKVLDD